MLDARLGAAAELVRQGAVFADIGTDHALLPIFLLESGRIERAVLADVNEGPLSRAERNVADRGLSDKVELVLTDGARELAGRGITDYAICGMVGELIADIISSAPHLETPEVKLILQPMTKQEHLRAYLYSHGYEIIAERYTEADGRYYICMHAQYVGGVRELSAVESLLGVSPVLGGRAEYLGYLRTKLKSTCAALRGKETGELDTSAEAMAVRALERRIIQLEEYAPAQPEPASEE